MNLEDITEYLRSIRKDASFIVSEVLETVAYRKQGPKYTGGDHPPRIHLALPQDRSPRLRDHPHRATCPEKPIVELKSLKYYFLQYRNAGIFYENLTQLILKHLVEKLQPLEMTVEAEFSARGRVDQQSGFDLQEIIRFFVGVTPLR